MSPAHARDGVDHSPTIAMELRQGMQIDIAIIDTHLPTKGGRIQPQVAMRELNALRACSRATGVVDCGGGIFVGSP